MGGRGGRGERESIPNPTDETPLHSPVGPRESRRRRLKAAGNVKPALHGRESPRPRESNARILAPPHLSICDSRDPLRRQRRAHTRGRVSRLRLYSSLTVRTRSSDYTAHWYDRSARITLPPSPGGGIDIETFRAGKRRFRTGIGQDRSGGESGGSRHPSPPFVPTARLRVEFFPPPTSSCRDNNGRRRAREPFELPTASR